MCGLVAVISKNKMGLYDKDVAVFEQLLFADQLRGSDGTGIFYNDRKNNNAISIIKHPIPSSTLLSSKEYHDNRSKIVMDGSFVVGHNRAATRGKLDVNCTHPFQEDHITLVHNGTLVTQKELHSTIEVDSHAICYHIAKYGARKTLKKINGAFALIWFNSKEHTLNICRNSQRPLHLFETKDTYVLTSEVGLGQWILGRNNIKIIRHFAVDTKKLYKFSMEDRSKFTQEEVEFKAPIFQQKNNQQNGNSADFYNNYTDFDDPTPQKNLPTTVNKYFSYSLGGALKFKAGSIIRGTGVHLEGRLLIQQEKDLSNRCPADYEDTHRIRVYGTEEELVALQSKEDLIGIIANTGWAMGRAVYYVKDVKEESTITPTKVLVLHPSNRCFYCSHPFKNGEVRYNIGKTKSLQACKKCMDAFNDKNGGEYEHRCN